MKPAKKAWSELGWQIVGAVGAVGLIVGVVSWGAWLTLDELDQKKKLQGVERVGPCRAAGVTDEECQKQARLIFAACYIQRERCREKYGLELVRVKRTPNPSRSVQGLGSEGSDALQPSTGKQQPGPGGGGEQVGGHGDGQSPGQKQEAKSSPPAPQADPGASSGDKGPDTAPPKGVAEQAADAVGGVVGEVKGVAQGAVCGAVAAPGCEKK